MPKTNKAEYKQYKSTLLTHFLKTRFSFTVKYVQLTTVHVFAFIRQQQFTGILKIVTHYFYRSS